MAPNLAQRSTLPYEDRVLSDQDVGLLYEIITRAERNPDVESLPFRALFAAYDEVVAKHGSEADPEQVCMGFLFKMGSGGLANQSLFERFESLLRRMGIVLSFDDTEPEPNRNRAQYPSASDLEGEQRFTDQITEDTIQRSQQKRRASFNSMYDVGEDGTQRHIYRPSSRSSMSRLDPGKPEFIQADDQPQEKQVHQDPTPLLDKNQLLAQFLEMGRQLMGGLDPIKGASQPSVGTTPYQSPTDPRLSVSSDSNSQSDSESSGQVDSLSPSLNENLDPEFAEAFQELNFKPSLSDMLRDASSFATYRRRATARKIFMQWLEQAIQLQQRRQDMETVAFNRDRRILLCQALDLWRAELVKKHQESHTKRFFRHLERRAAKARDLYLMTKAFTHWAQLTSDELSKASAAREHILSIKYFNAWREITAVNGMKSQRFTIRKPLDGWRRKIQQIRMQEEYASETHVLNSKRKYFMILRRNYHFEHRAPEWNDYRLMKCSFLSWIRALRTQREREADIDLTNRLELLHASLQTWSYRSRLVNAAQHDADTSYTKKLVGDQIEVWSAQTRLHSAAIKTMKKTNLRLMKTAIVHWKIRTESVREAKQADRTRVLRNAWSSWNEYLRCYALNARIEERLKKEAIYKWVLAERFRLAQRIRDQRIQREAFAKFIITSRDTSRELLQREDKCVRRYNSKILHSHLSLWRNKLAVQYQRDYAAMQFYVPRIEQEALTIWYSKHHHIKNLDKWAQDARFYFAATKSIKTWHNAAVDATKKRRQEAYGKIRRKIKMNIASSALRVWYDKSRRITNLNNQAKELNHTKLLFNSTELVDRWRQQTAKVAQDTQDADVYYHRQLAYYMLTQWMDEYEKYRSQEEQADAFNLVHVSGLASAQLRKLSLRVFQVQSAAEMAESLHDRISRKHHRNMLRHWNNKARMQHNEHEPMVPTDIEIVTHEPNTPGTVIATESEHTLNLSELGSLPEHRLASTTPIATPGYLASPSRRAAARARMFAQMSTTPATPLFTPFASRLRAALDGDRIGSDAKSRRSSVGTIVRFAIEDPESPTQGRKSSLRKE